MKYLSLDRCLSGYVYTKDMQKSKDTNVIASRVVSMATDEKRIAKNPAAVALGRLGGLKGGRARAERLTPERRIEIAKKAALAKWGAPNNV